MSSPQRIAVIGCGGSGKTYAATRLAERHGLPLVHADDLVHRGGVLQPEAEWQAELARVATATRG
ncbi:MAG TPA: hypothetical protein VFA56_11005 [Gaiellaceae bacterium]|nr:hypothetical protein [Gaiellaceae bacterium]